MTKEELQAQTKEIESKWGKAEWDMACPVNESAKRISELRASYRTQNVVEKARLKREAKQQDRVMQPEGLKDIAANIVNAPEYKTNSQNSKNNIELSIPELFLSKQELAPFTVQEADIIQTYFRNLNQTYKTVADIHGVPYQFVTALFDSPAFKYLYAKVYDRILPLEALMTIHKAMKRGDSKTALDIARHYKLISSEKLDVNVSNKPIEDSNAIKMLKKLGDTLVTPEQGDEDRGKQA